MKTRLLRLSALIALAYAPTIVIAANADATGVTTEPTIGVNNTDAPAASGANNVTNNNANSAPSAAVPVTTTAPISQITVTAGRLDRARNSISVETGSSIYRIGPKEIAALPQGDDTSFNQVLLQAPGVAQDSFGQLHVRGDHANLQYRLNGILLPESISGFGQTLDTRFVNNISFLTGALPAQYGYRTAGVVNVQTKTGEDGNGGDIGVQFGSNHTQEITGDVRGSTDNFSYYINGAFDANDLGIENTTGASTAIHDRTLQNKAFGYFSYILNPDTRVSLILGNSDNRFQIPNIPGQTPTYQLAGAPADYQSADLDERQRETTRYGILALQGSINSQLDYQIAAFSRYTKTSFDPDDIGDLMFTGVASKVVRTGLANGLQADGSYKLNDSHTIRSGVAYTRETLNNSTDALTFPADSDGNQLSTTPFAINESDQKTTDQIGVYLQDEWKLTDKLTMNYGARADWVNAYVKANQFSPRIGFVYQMTPSTTFHAGYAKYFTPPASELIAASTVTNFNGTTNASPSSQNGAVQAESSDYFDAGVNQQLTQHLTLGLDAYYKKVKNLLDEGQFGSALLYTPFNYAQGKIYGLELTLNYHKDNLSAYFNLARATAMGKDIISSQYNFDQAELDYISNHWVHLDHDQRLSASAGMSYLWRGTTYSTDALFGSGLRSGFANTDHLPAYTVVNVGASHVFTESPIGKVTARFNVTNLFDRVYEIRDGTGIGVGAPQYGQRRGFYVAMSKAF
ncbi:TonB-dependent receptor [Glaciimonas soli]|uniref:TonB-dependent receptor plug domain-containing protein n=1 Tax=Glaciimonas soli TaxID=2590999 RepID=A0A843YNJ3_9BURK|nr:TonB-dependent receptor [Glaciimonas soli]MQQ99122.1 TonB-dependent receptor plug domain-containing protein [Glaciimonas soli]